MDKLIEWILTQGGMVILLVFSILGFFRFLVPVYTRQQERHEEVLQTVAQDHRERADRQHEMFTETIKELASTHERAVDKVVSAFERKTTKP